MITAYFAQLEKVIQTFPNVRSYELRKKVYNARQGYISGSIVFESGCRLDFVEVKNTDIEAKLKYRYQCMDEKHEVIFRYDNAPHHRDLQTFPHHRHDPDDVSASAEPDLNAVLLEIAERERRS